MISTTRRDAIVEMARYLGQEFDFVPAAEWQTVLVNASQAPGDRPSNVADAVERILDLVRALQGQALPLAAGLAFACGAPPALEQVCAAALRPQGEGGADVEVQPDMLIAPDRYFTQSIETTLGNGVLELHLPRLHPGPKDGMALIWIGSEAGSARDKRMWREQRDHLAAVTWRFASGEVYRPIDQAPCSLAAASLPEARFLRQVLTIPAHLIEASKESGGIARATVPWSFDTVPVLTGNPALIGVSGTQRLTVVRSATAGADGNAEVRLSDGPARHAPVSIERNGSSGSGVGPSRIPRQDGVAIRACWSFDPIDNMVLLHGLEPGETLDMRIQLRLDQGHSLETVLASGWTGPGALRWRLTASLTDQGLAPAGDWPASIGTAADLSAALLALDPFPETLDMRSAEVTVEPRIFVADGRLALGQQVTIRVRRPVATSSLAELENALAVMLRSAAMQPSPLHVRVRHDS